MPVVTIGSVLLRFDFLREGDDRENKVETQVDNVLVVPGMGFNMFSGWRVSVNGHAVSLHADGTHIMNGKLIFMRGPTSDYSYAIRLPPPQTDTIVQHEIANVSLASSVPLSPAPCESASLVSPTAAVEPTFDWCLCVETFPGMSLGPEAEAVLSDTRPSRGCDASVAWCFSPESIPVEMVEPLAPVWDESERAENSVQFLDAVKREVHGLIEAGAFEVVDE